MQRKLLFSCRKPLLDKKKQFFEKNALIWFYHFANEFHYPYKIYSDARFFLNQKVYLLYQIRLYRQPVKQIWRWGWGEVLLFWKRFIYCVSATRQRLHSIFNYRMEHVWVFTHAMTADLNELYGWVMVKGTYRGWIMGKHEKSFSWSTF